MRCPICDDCEGPFTQDPFNKDFVCIVCAEMIQETSGSDWAEEYDDELSQMAKDFGWDPQG